MSRSHPLTRRTLLTGVAAAAATAAVGCRPDADVPVPSERPGRAAWLGNAGWRLRAGGYTLLVDPFISRFSTGLTKGSFDPATPITIDEAAIRQAVPEADAILVTHTHWDHFADVPFLGQEYGARVVGTATAKNLAISSGLPAGQAKAVDDGDKLNLGPFRVSVIGSRHSRPAGGQVLFPGNVERPGPAPATISDLVEGGTLSYLVHRKGGARVFLTGASDFDPDALAGVKPDIAMVSVPWSGPVDDYVEGLLTALGRPATVVPVHWDDFEIPLVNPPKAGTPLLEAFTAAVRRVAPKTTVVRPRYLEDAFNV